MQIQKPRQAQAVRELHRQYLVALSLALAAVVEVLMAIIAIRFWARQGLVAVVLVETMYQTEAQQPLAQRTQEAVAVALRQVM